MASGRRYKIIILAIFLIILAVSCIKPPFPAEMFLQHSATLVMTGILMVITFRNSLSDRSFTLVVAFMLLHVLGARWIYSYVPYDDWFRAVTGTTLTGTFHFTRNHYDRFVHLMFGMIMLFPLKEIYERWFGCPGRFSVLIAFLTLTAFSMAYEVFEWGLTLVLSPQDAEDYNGQQGDMWDAQKDMALAFTGALISMLILTARNHLRPPGKNQGT